MMLGLERGLWGFRVRVGGTCSHPAASGQPLAMFPAAGGVVFREAKRRMFLFHFFPL